MLQCCLKPDSKGTTSLSILKLRSESGITDGASVFFRPYDAGDCSRTQMCKTGPWGPANAGNAFKRSSRITNNPRDCTNRRELLSCLARALSEAYIHTKSRRTISGLPRGFGRRCQRPRRTKLANLLRFDVFELLL